MFALWSSPNCMSSPMMRCFHWSSSQALAAWSRNYSYLFVGMSWSTCQASSKSARCQYCIQYCQRYIQYVSGLLFWQILYLNTNNSSISWQVEGLNWSIYYLSGSHKFTFGISEIHYSKIWAIRFWSQSLIGVFYYMTPFSQLAANAGSCNRHRVFPNRCRDFEHQSAYLICIWSHFPILGY